MSSGFRSAILKALPPEMLAPLSVKSFPWLITVPWVRVSPQPSKYTGCRRRSLALSDEVTITAPPPSEMTQHSRNLKGEEIILEFNTSFMVNGFRNMALGLRDAHFLVATDISARWASVEPN